ncbi:hypothetical protein [Leptospira ilyithenensis]|uniref:Uncharacterized protein n=1 Tax=Leptospira ilyithenensis TaxID=2484901 RepID=A0A4R9LJU3_9LEPT|nr:hypothetical protein [Leptospira ilyithenensis]TGN07113.1 hypothetical protein EHS11_18535 [Leptospira ilyithenensis]
MNDLNEVKRTGFDEITKVADSGTFPFWQVQEADPKFYIYDHQLNLINTRAFMNKYEGFPTGGTKKNKELFIEVLKADLCPIYTNRM